MCGPLALALPPGGDNRAAFVAGRVAYNLGRLVTYSLIGALFGLLGQGFALAGLQRWVSLIAGAVILIGLVATRSKLNLGATATRAVGWLKSGLGQLLRRRTFGALFAIGLLNGLLPCGLVYAAAISAVTTGHVAAGMLYMMVFGLGTVPMMLTLALAGQKIQLALRFKLQRLIPYSLALIGALLLLRGLGLGIPYLSPAISDEPGTACACH
jgi:sulfite exporter TauE/SafE